MPVLTLPHDPPPIRNVEEARRVIQALWKAVRMLTEESGLVAANHNSRIQELEQRLGIER